MKLTKAGESLAAYVYGVALVANQATAAKVEREVRDRIAAVELEAKGRKPDWATTVVAGNEPEALLISVKKGSIVSTSEGDFRFERAGDWMLLPVALWRRTLARLRQAEARMTGRGDGGPARSN